MTTLSNEDLVALNHRGLIFGPEEDEETFLRRKKTVETLSQHPEIALKAQGIPSHLCQKVESETWDLARKKTRALFGVAPDWIEGFYSDKKLSFWQGAATWICELNGEQTIPILQLRKELKSGKLMSIYPVQEVLAHESVHAVRSAFNEPKFEEIFAFQTSKNTFRKLFGPLFRTPLGTYFFALTLVFSFLSQLAILIFSWPSPKLYFTFTLLPFFTLVFFALRLMKDQFLLLRCLKRLSSLFSQDVSPKAVALRLTDKEIKMFASKSLEKIRTYMKKKEFESLRWRQILSSYLLK